MTYERSVNRTHDSPAYFGYDEITEEYADIDITADQAANTVESDRSSYTFPLPATPNYPYDYPYAMTVNIMRNTRANSGYIEIIDEPSGKYICLI